jgi:hypothetical protein
MAEVCDKIRRLLQAALLKAHSAFWTRSRSKRVVVVFSTTLPDLSVFERIVAIFCLFGRNVVLWGRGIFGWAVSRLAA